MLQMTQYINSEWKTHVADTGVTCYTCHRGQPVPSALWFKFEPAALWFEFHG
jgi:photosynthetic reaction center cytochrome c subunit